MRKTKNYLTEKNRWLWEIASRFLRARERRKAAGYVAVVCQKLGITAYTLENYSNFKSKFSYNNASILEIYDYFRTRGNASFNDLS